MFPSVSLSPHYSNRARLWMDGIQQDPVPESRQSLLNIQGRVGIDNKSGVSNMIV